MSVLEIQEKRGDVKIEVQDGALALDDATVMKFLDRMWIWFASNPGLVEFKVQWDAQGAGYALKFEMADGRKWKQTLSPGATADGCEMDFKCDRFQLCEIVPRFVAFRHEVINLLTGHGVTKIEATPSQ